jgi:hypothetical protein
MTDDLAGLRAAESFARRAAEARARAHKSFARAVHAYASLDPALHRAMQEERRDALLVERAAYRLLVEAAFIHDRAATRLSIAELEAEEHPTATQRERLARMRSELVLIEEAMRTSVAA